MRNVVGSVIFLFCLISCNSRNSLLTEREFTHVYRDSLSGHIKKASFKIIDDKTISAAFDGNDIRISIDNAFLEYSATPDSLAQVIHKYVTVANDLFTYKKSVDINSIVPSIKPNSYLNEITAMAGLLMQRTQRTV